MAHLLGLEPRTFRLTAESLPIELQKNIKTIESKRQRKEKDLLKN